MDISGVIFRVKAPDGPGSLIPEFSQLVVSHIFRKNGKKIVHDYTLTGLLGHSRQP
jgi:hypothetical protein